MSTGQLNKPHKRGYLEDSLDGLHELLNDADFAAENEQFDSDDWNVDEPVAAASASASID